MNVKKIVSLLLALALVLSMAACGSSGSSAANDGSSGGEIVVTIPTYYVGENVGAIYFEPAVARFNEQNAGKYRIELEEVIEQSYTDIISQRAQANQLPVILATPSTEWVQTVIIPQKLYEPMNDFLDAHPDIKALCLDSSVDYCTQENGDIVSIPVVTTSTIGLFYNSDMYSPSKPVSQMTVDEFLTSLGDNKMAFQTVDNAWTSVLFLTAMIANEEGGTELLKQYDGEKLYDFNQPCILSAVTKFQQLWGTYAAANSVGAAYPDAANGFMSGQAAVICNGSWMNSEFDESSSGNWSNDFNGANVNADYYPGNIAIGGTRAYGRWMMTNNGTDEEKECAAAFLAFLYSKEELETFALTEGCQIPNMTFSDGFLSQLDDKPLIKQQTELCTSDTTMVPNFTDIMVSSVSTSTFANDLVQLVNGNMTPEEFCQDLTTKSQEAMDA